MVANTVIIFSGPGVTDTPDPALQIREGKTLVDWWISQLRRQGRTVHVVLGANGDDLLSQCPGLLMIDFIFDPNWHRGPFAQVKAALSAGVSPTLVVDPRRDWSLRPEDLIRFERSASIHSDQSRGATDVYFMNPEDPWNSPWIITRQGHEKILRMSLDENPLQKLTFTTVRPMTEPANDSLSSPTPAVS